MTYSQKTARSPYIVETKTVAFKTKTKTAGTTTKTVCPRTKTMKVVSLDCPDDTAGTDVSLIDGELFHP